MQAIWTLIMEQLKQQGLTVLLLFAAIVFFYTERSTAMANIDLCHKELIELYRNDRLITIQAIDRNTEALKELQKR